jgi:hypothetical protein
MHEHDLDLVADLATADPTGDVGAARELVRTCAECRAEYELHLRFRHALAGLPAVALTTEERSRLRAGVTAALPTEVATDAPAAARRRIPIWWRVVPVAAAAAVVLAIGGLIGGSQGGDTADLASVAAEDAEERSAEADGQEDVAGAPELAEQTTTTASADLLGPMSASPPQVDSVEELVELLVEDPQTSSFTPEAFACGSSTTRPATAGRAGTVDGVVIEVFLVEGEGEPSVEGFTLPDCEPLELPPAPDR